MAHEEARSSLTVIREECERLMQSGIPVLANFATRVLAEVWSCEAQLPGSPPPSHGWDVPDQ